MLSNERNKVVLWFYDDNDEISAMEGMIMMSAATHILLLWTHRSALPKTIIIKVSLLVPSSSTYIIVAVIPKAQIH